MSAAIHTPLPWAIDQSGLRLEVINEETTFTVCRFGGLTPPHSANAALIVRSVNNHADLLAVLEYVVQQCDGMPVAARCRAAIAKARAES